METAGRRSRVYPHGVERGDGGARGRQSQRPGNDDHAEHDDEQQDDRGDAREQGMPSQAFRRCYLAGRLLLHSMGPLRLRPDRPGEP